MSASRRVAVTGATGFIGRQTLAPLLERGYEVHALARKPPPGGLLPDVCFHACDLLDPKAVHGTIAALRPSHLLHLAWYVEHGLFWKAARNLDWTAASLHLMQAFAGCGGERAVFAGTCAEYDWSHALCSEATTPLAPQTLYGACKHGLRTIVSRFLEDRRIGWGWGRVFLLYGPHEPPQRLIPSVVLALLRGEPARCSHGRQVRDFMHVADVGAAFAAFLDSAVTGPVNIASGEARPIADVVNLLGAELGRTDLIRLGAIPAPANDPPELRAAVERLHDEVGFRNRFDLEEGLRDAVNWWRAAAASAHVTNGSGRAARGRGSA